MKKQTSVEWLVDQIFFSDQREEFEKYIQQAKAMEKEQIIDAFEQGEYTGRGFEDLTSEEYYDINFKSE